MTCSKLIIRCISSVLCSIGAFYQVYQVLVLYFEYPVAITTKLSPSDQFKLPTIALCPEWQVPNVQKLELSVRDVFERTFNVNQVIAYCRVRLPDNHRVHCEHLAPITTGVMFDYKCFVLFERNVLNYVHRHLTDNILIQFQLQLNTSSMANYLGISIYDQQNLYPFEGSPTFAVFHLDLVKRVSVTYSWSNVTFLEHPYPSDCIDYKDHYKMTRAEVVDKCVIDTFKGSWPSDVVAFNNSDLKFGEYASKERARCYEQFNRAECSNLIYKIEPKSTWLGNSTRNRFDLDIYAPGGLEFEVTEEPEFEMIEFLSHIIDLFNLWLGFAIVHVFYVLFRPFVRRSRPLFERIDIRQRYIIAERRRKRKRAKAYAIAVCCVGCMAQVYEVLYISVTSPFSSSVKLIKPSQLELPLITVCVRNDHWPKKGRSAREQFDDAPSSRQVFVMAEMLSEEMEYESVFERFSIIERTSATKKCFTLFDEQIASDGSAEELVYQRNALKNVYWTRFRLSKPDHWRYSVAVHGRGSLPVSRGYPELLKLEVERTKRPTRRCWFMVTYDRIVRTLIGGHRLSSCVDYNTIGFGSRQEAIDNCTLEHFLDHYASLPPKLYVARNFTNLNLKFEDKENSYASVIKSCRRKYRKHHCTDVQHNVRLDQTHLWQFNGTVGLDLLAPQSGDLTVEQEFRESLVEIVSNVAGLLSIWVDFSVLHLIEFFLKRMF